MTRASFENQIPIAKFVRPEKGWAIFSDKSVDVAYGKHIPLEDLEINDESESEDQVCNLQAEKRSKSPTKKNNKKFKHCPTLID